VHHEEHTRVEANFINGLILKIQREDIGHTYIAEKTAFSRTEREARYCETGMSSPSPVII
jgi:hypothetical protein